MSPPPGVAESVIRLLLAGIVFASSISLHAARIEVGGQHFAGIPTGDSGELDVVTSRGFGASVEVFWRDDVSTRVSASFLNPAAILFPENPPPTDVDLGTLGLDIYAATARWHYGIARNVSAFAGGGGAFVVIGNLDDRFGDEVEVNFDPELTFIVEGGARYRFRERIVFELGVAYLPVEGTPDVVKTNIDLPETFAFDPLIVSAGVAWRF